MNAEDITAAFVSTIKRFNPDSMVSETIRRFYVKDFQKTFIQSGLDPIKVVNTLGWAKSQPEYKEGFLSDAPQWWFIKNWNNISSNYMASCQSQPGREVKSDVEKHDGFISDIHLAEIKRWHERNGEMADFDSIQDHQDMIRRDPKSAPIKNPHPLTFKAAEKMRQQMINLGMYNMDGPNEALIRAGVEPLVRKNSPPASMKDLTDQIGGGVTQSELDEEEIPF